MSSPNQPTPDGSATQGGLSSWASKTAAQRKAETTAPVKNSLETNFFGSWISNMFGGFFNGVLGLISSLVFGLKGITGGLIDLTGALKATDQKATSAVNTANGAVSTVVTVQKEIVQKFAVFDIRSPVPLYVALNRTEWPSISWESAFDMQANDVNIPAHKHKENNQTGSFATTDDTTIGSVPVRMTGIPEKAMTGVLQRFAFIVVPVDTPLSGLNFYARGTPTDLRTRVYLMAPTGDMSQLTPESTNLAGLLVSANHTATPVAFSDVIVEAGSIVVVRFSVVGTVYLMGRQKAVVEPPAGFYPKHIGATSALPSGTAAPDFIAESSISWADGFVVYVAIGNNIVVAQPKRVWDDTFDREDSGGLFGIGNSWSGSTNVGIRDNELGYITDSDGLGYQLYSKPLTTEYQLHRIRVGLLPLTDRAQSALSRLYFRCTQNRSTGLCVAFRQGLIVLQTVSGQTTFANVTPNVSRTLATGDTIEVQQGEKVDGVYYPDRVLVRHNGIEIIRTDVPSATVPYGPQRRYGALGFQRTPFQNSPRVMDWVEADISDIEEAT